MIWLVAGVLTMFALGGGAYAGPSNESTDSKIKRTNLYVNLYKTAYVLGKNDRAAKRPPTTKNPYNKTSSEKAAWEGGYMDGYAGKPSRFA